MTQRYKDQILQISEKMAAMERLLIEQRQKGQRLESELSSAQDRIGGAERRARMLEEENTKIKGELQSWNDYYAQEETSPEYPVSTSMVGATSIPVSTSLFNMETPMSMPCATLPIEQSITQAMSGPSFESSSTLAISQFGGVLG